MKENDLRVIKTKNAIKKEFLHLMEKKELDKITVTELVQKALINKSTFYLHYHDIYDLYEDVLNDFFSETMDINLNFNQFFNKPEAFIRDFSFHIESTFCMRDILFQEKYASLFHSKFVKYLINKLYETNCIEKNAENDIKLETIFQSLLSIAPKHPNDKDIIDSVIITMIKTLFPV